MDHKYTLSFEKSIRLPVGLFHHMILYFLFILEALFLPQMVQAANGTLTGSGIEGDPFLITDYEDLKSVGTIYGLNKVYQLQNDIDATPSRTENGNAGFLPIGNTSNKFTGVFHGAGHAIKGLEINRPDFWLVGLFGYTSAAIIDNLMLANIHIFGGGAYTGGLGGLVGRTYNGSLKFCTVTGTIATGLSENVGGLVGYNEYCILLSCSTSVAIIADSCDYVGGLVGYNDVSSLNSCCATGPVSGQQYVGGLIGNDYYGTVRSCYATGTVTANTFYAGFVGGIAGATSGKSNFILSYATGEVHAQTGANIGGLVGQNHGKLLACFATGSVDGGNNAGGLVGNIVPDTFSVRLCYATGQVTGGFSVGGLVGNITANYGGLLSSCYATGAVTASGNSAGGLIGKMALLGELNSCYATGPVNGQKLVGGLIGENSTPCIETSCYWNIETTGKSVDTNPCPNVSGLTSAKMLLATSFVGWNFDTTWILCPGDSAPKLRVFSPSCNPSSVKPSSSSAISLGKFLKYRWSLRNNRLAIYYPGHNFQTELFDISGRRLYKCSVSGTAYIDLPSASIFIVAIREGGRRESIAITTSW